MKESCQNFAIKLGFIEEQQQEIIEQQQEIIKQTQVIEERMLKLRKVMEFFAKDMAKTKTEDLLLIVAQIENCLEIALIGKLLRPHQANLAHIKRIQTAQAKIMDRNLKSNFDKDPAVEKLLEIIETRYQEFDQFRYCIDCPPIINLEEADSLIKKLSSSPYDKFKSADFEKVVNWLQELRDIPNMDEILDYYDQNYDEYVEYYEENEFY